MRRAGCPVPDQIGPYPSDGAAVMYNVDMALSPNYMPYAPAAPVLNIIRRARDGRLQEAYTTEQLHRLGVAEGNADRVQKSLEFLGLIDDEDALRTAAFERLSRVSTDEYPAALAELVQSAYASVLAVVDPQSATDVAIHDAFRGYDPAAQRPRMVGLFLALCREAGIVEGGPIQGQRVHVRTRAATRPPIPSRATGQRAPRAPLPTPPAPDHNGMEHGGDAGPDYRLLAQLIQQLPRDGRWTTTRREKWIQAVTATVDLLVTLNDEGEGP